MSCRFDNVALHVGLCRHIFMLLQAKGADVYCTRPQHRLPLYTGTGCCFVLCSHTCLQTCCMVSYGSHQIGLQCYLKLGKLLRTLASSFVLLASTHVMTMGVDKNP